MKILNHTLILLILISSSLFSKEKLNQLYNEIKINHILSGELNSSSYLYRVKYNSPSCGGLSYHLGYYVNGDTTLKTNTNVDGGIYTGNDIAPKKLQDFTTQLGDLYLRFKRGSISAFHGKSTLNTPMTHNLYSMIPNFYDYSKIKKKLILKTEVSLAHIRAMSYGSRAYSDYTIIGDNTYSAGATSLATTKRAEFIDIGTISGADVASTYKMMHLSVRNSLVPYTVIKLHEYYTTDLLQMLYTDVITKYPFTSDLRSLFGIQYLSQKGLKSTTFDSSFASYTSSIYGIMLGSESFDNTFKSYISYTKNGSSDIFNPWGGDPLWSSTMFSRNEYRASVSAIKFHYYQIMPDMFGLFFQSDIALYTKSNFATATRAGSEVDLISGFDLKNGNYFKFIYNYKVSEIDKALDMKVLRILIGLKY